MSKPHAYLRSSITTQNRSQFRSRYYNIVVLHPQTLTKSIPITTWNKANFDRTLWNQVNIDHPVKKQVNFDAHNKTKNRFNFDHRNPHKNKNISIITLKTSWFRPTHGQWRPPEQKTSHFRSQHRKQVQSDPLRRKQINFNATSEIKSIRSPI